MSDRMRDTRYLREAFGHVPTAVVIIGTNGSDDLARIAVTIADLTTAT